MNPTPAALLARAAATLAAAALTLTTASPALAASDALIDATRTGSITLHKLLVDPANGREVPAAGVTFTIERADGVDLGTPVGWGTATLAQSTGPVTLTLSAPATATTGADGQAKFRGLPVGLYRVTETDPPGDPRPIDPFWLTVPMTDPQDPHRWLYDVHAYPKSVGATPIPTRAAHATTPDDPGTSAPAQDADKAPSPGTTTAGDDMLAVTGATGGALQIIAALLLLTTGTILVRRRRAGAQ